MDKWCKMTVIHMLHGDDRSLECIDANDVSRKWSQKQSCRQILLEFLVAIFTQTNKSLVALFGSE